MCLFFKRRTICDTLWGSVHDLNINVCNRLERFVNAIKIQNVILSVKAFIEMFIFIGLADDSNLFFTFSECMLKKKVTKAQAQMSIVSSQLCCCMHRITGTQNFCSSTKWTNF